MIYKIIVILGIQIALDGLVCVTSLVIGGSLGVSLWKWYDQRKLQVPELQMEIEVIYLALPKLDMPTRTPVHRRITHIHILKPQQ